MTDLKATEGPYYFTEIADIGWIRTKRSIADGLTSWKSLIVWKATGYRKNHYYR